MFTLSLPEADMSCESEVAVRNDYALRFWNISKPPPIIEYVKAISALIGASHVLAVFEEDDAIKVFFDDRRYVDTLIKKGIHVLGHHVRADYVVPPGIKVILSNVDPVIPNFDVMKHLSVYGSVVSPVVRPSICDDVEFCHIGYGVRYVYMVLEGVLPSRLELKQGDQLSYIKIEIEDNTNDVPIKPDRSQSDDEEASDYSNNLIPILEAENSNAPIVVSVQSTSDEGLGETIQKPPMEVNPDINPILSISRKTQFQMHLKRKRLTSAAQAAKKITQNVKHKWGAKQGRPFKKARRGRGRMPFRYVAKKSSSSSSSEEDPEASKNVVARISPTKPIMDDRSLRLFLEEVKHQRVPLQLAKKYLGEGCGTDKVHKLIDQLRNFAERQGSQNLKLRIGRLIKCLKEAIEDSS